MLRNQEEWNLKRWQNLVYDTFFCLTWEAKEVWGWFWPDVFRWSVAKHQGDPDLQSAHITLTVKSFPYYPCDRKQNHYCLICRHEKSLNRQQRKKTMSVFHLGNSAEGQREEPCWNVFFLFQLKTDFSPKPTEPCTVFQKWLA